MVGFSMFKNKQPHCGAEEQSLAPDPMTATDEPYPFDSPGGGGFTDDFNGSFYFEEDSAKPDYSSVAGPALGIGGGDTTPAKNQASGALAAGGPPFGARKIPPAPPRPDSRSIDLAQQEPQGGAPTETTLEQLTDSGAQTVAKDVGLGGATGSGGAATLVDNVMREPKQSTNTTTETTKPNTVPTNVPIHEILDQAPARSERPPTKTTAHGAPVLTLTKAATKPAFLRSTAPRLAVVPKVAFGTTTFVAGFVASSRAQPRPSVPFTLGAAPSATDNTPRANTTTLQEAPPAVTPANGMRVDSAVNKHLMDSITEFDQDSAANGPPLGQGTDTETSFDADEYGEEGGGGDPMPFQTPPPTTMPGAAWEPEAPDGVNMDDFERNYQELLDIIRNAQDTSNAYVNTVLSDTVLAQSALGELLLFQSELMDLVLSQEEALMEVDAVFEEALLADAALDAEDTSA